MGDRARVFFALWPDQPVRRALHDVGRRLHQALKGRLTRTPSIHLTLLFVGDVEEGRLDALRDAASTVTVEPFTMLLDRAACWRHHRIAWVGPSNPPQALEGLAMCLRTRTAEAGFAFDRKPFAAHVTLLRDADCAVVVDRIAPVDWDVREFVLVRSRLDAAGSRYEVIGRWGGGGEE